MTTAIPNTEGLYRRSERIPLPMLRETYLHLTNRCLTNCRYCYCSANTAEDPTELSTEAWMQLIGRLAELGVANFVFIGGDPFLRSDIMSLIRHVTQAHGRKLRIFYNGYVSTDRAEQLVEHNNGKLVMVGSLEGPTPDVNDTIRGEGNMARSVQGIRNLIEAGLTPVINTVVTSDNMDRLPGMAEFLQRLGIERWHLLFPYNSGRMRENRYLIPDEHALADVILSLWDAAGDGPLFIDNFASWRIRLDGRYDLCNAGYDLLTIGHDGGVYPCQVTVGDAAFRAGSVLEQDIEEIWRESPVMQTVRDVSFTANPKCRNCDVRETCGGECMIHSYYSGEAFSGTGSLAAEFPYCAMTGGFIRRLMADLPVNKTDGLKYIECT